MKVALLGAPGSGKSVVAERLCQHLGTKIAFADALRKEVADVLTPLQGHGVLRRMADPSTKDLYRPILQQWGMLRREADVDYWVRKLTATIDPIIAIDSNITIAVDDCRMPNEYEALRSRGFYFVRLEAGPHLRLQTPEARAHISEGFWPTFPVDIVLDYQPASIQAARIRDAIERGRP